MQPLSFQSPDLLQTSLLIGQSVLTRRTEQQRKENGQYFTPASVARFMATRITPGIRILDPSIGSGVLAMAVIENSIALGGPKEIWLDGFETDTELYMLAKECLSRSVEEAASHGIKIHVNLYNKDFLLEGIKVIMPSLLGDEPSLITPVYDCIIANPPYFKLNVDDPRVKAVTYVLKGHTNIYTLFMALALRLLNKTGQACFIVPRSFCSGAYFSGFRRDFLEQATPISVHLFESRVDTFKMDEVLQENIIITFRKKQSNENTENEFFVLSTSKTIEDLSTNMITRTISMRSFMGRHNGDILFRLPTGDLDEEIIHSLDQCQGSLDKYGFIVSTGPVVSFRSRELLTDSESVSNGKAVPLLWMNNIKPQEICWPIKGNKPQGIILNAASFPLTVKNQNSVILRRFSAKEEIRRLIAAPFLRDEFQHPIVGLENHLNFIQRKAGELDREETIGLSALYNSSLMDRYFRIINGNTQVNAAELRAMPLPSLAVIREIGNKIIEAQKQNQKIDIDELVISILRANAYLSPDFPIIKETRITMGKIQQAQEILKSLGLPAAQQNEMSALILLVLGGLTEEKPWSEIVPANLRIHDMLIEIQSNYDRRYAENTRETIRRQVVHQFIQAGLVAQNVDEPKTPINSPHNRYMLSEAAVQVLRTYQTPEWEDAIKIFRQNQGALLEIYRKNREQHKIPLILPSGEQYLLSPGKHNEVEVAIITEFGPRFAPSAVILYVGDTEYKSLHLKVEKLDALNIPLSSHDKLPDIVLYDEKNNRLFLIEVVTTHGPISPKRYYELEKMLKNCTASRVYISAFPDFKEFKKYLVDIAWETEVWIAEIPDHMIHFNGDHFIR